jgi:hypothetical protein
MSVDTALRPPRHRRSERTVLDIVVPAIADLKGIARLGRAIATGRLPLAELRWQLGRNAQLTARTLV